MALQHVKPYIKSGKDADRRRPALRLEFALALRP